MQAFETFFQPIVVCMPIITWKDVGYKMNEGKRNLEVAARLIISCKFAGAVSLFLLLLQKKK